MELLRDFYHSLYEERTPKCNKRSNIEAVHKIVDETERIANFSNNNTAGKPSNPQFATISEIAQIIKNNSNKISVGPDKIPNIIIKKLPINYIISLTRLINHCINNGYFPSAWKEGIIIPIPKKQGTLTPKDFRPICLTPSLGKILESVIYNRMKKEIKIHYIPESQFGFKEGHSTIDALTVFNSSAKDAIKNKEIMAVGSIDIEKAFDSVWGRGLVYKVDDSGCKIHTTKIVKSFLNNRCAKIKFNDNLSDKFNVNRGVPQGTRLGPILYNIYTADMIRNIKINHNVNIQTYADDTLISYKCMCPYKACEKLTEKIEELNNYFQNWGIKINGEKTNLLIFKPPKKSWRHNRSSIIKKKKKLEIKVVGMVIKKEKTLKYLGVTFQQNLKFNIH